MEGFHESKQLRLRLSSSNLSMVLLNDARVEFGLDVFRSFSGEFELLWFHVSSVVLIRELFFFLAVRL
jgi:hypothetical protein